MSLIVHSRSTKRFIKEWKYERTLLVTKSPDESILKRAKTEECVIAIGGGAVIDTAKILSKNPIIAIPTTFAGASRTRHAVYWIKGRKYNYPCPKPITIARPEYLKTLPRDFYHYSLADCISHAVESLISKKATPFSRYLAETALHLVKKGGTENHLFASFLAGDAIEITETNIIHALSYPLTGLYKVPHGKAIAYLLPKILPYYGLEDKVSYSYQVDLEIDIEKIIKHGMKYSKIKNTIKPVNERILRRLLKN